MSRTCRGLVPSLVLILIALSPTPSGGARARQKGHHYVSSKISFRNSSRLSSRRGVSGQSFAPIPHSVSRPSY